ncbi:hypothetical protein PUN28_013742 [Cardiocondyla obscurior]|uniref:Secreted protein n=1 Tax=Cardiocondyla obscurior TaxID=286306 RepID=A0AAW2F446_9HYME
MYLFFFFLFYACIYISELKICVANYAKLKIELYYNFLASYKPSFIYRWSRYFYAFQKNFFFNFCKTAIIE